MDEVAVDEDQAGSVGAPFDDVRVPDFLIEGAGPSHAVHLSRLHNNASEWRSKTQFSVAIHRRPREGGGRRRPWPACRRKTIAAPAFAGAPRWSITASCPPSPSSPSDRKSTRLKSSNYYAHRIPSY